MAITVETRTEIIELVVGMVDAAPGADILSELADIVDAGLSIRDLAIAIAANPAFKALYPSFLTNEEFATNYLTSFIGDEVSAETLQGSIDAMTADLNAGASRGAVMYDAINTVSDAAEDDAAFGAAGTMLANKVTVAINYSVTTQQSGDTLDELVAVVSDVTSDAASVTAALESVSTTANPGTNYALTDAIDTFQGGGGNDTFIASETTFTSGDSLNGGGGTDRLNLIATDDADGLVDLTSVEQVYIRNTSNGQEVNASGWAGVSQVWYDRGTDDLEVTDLNAVVTAGIKGGDDTDSDFTLTYASTSGTQTQNIVLEGADVHTVTIEGVEIVNISSTGSDNSVADLDTDDSAEELSISGDQDLEISGALEASIVDIDASSASGGITIEIQNDVSDADDTLSVVLGSGADDLTAGDVLNDVDEDAVVLLDGGAGSDTLAVNDQIDSDIDFDDQVINFEKLQLDAAVDYDLDGYDWVETIQVNYTVDYNNTISNVAEGVVVQSFLANGVGTTALTIDHAEAGDVGTQTQTYSAYGVSGAATVTALTIDGVETITIANNGLTGASTTITAFDADELRELTIAATKALDITFSDTVADSISAGSSTGDLTLDITAAQDTAIAVTLGSGDDTLTYDAAGAYGHQLTLGDGEDTVVIENVDGGAVEVLADIVTISDFNTGNDGDIIDLSGAAGTIVSDSDLADIQEAVDEEATLTAALDAALAISAGADDVLHFEFDDNTYVVYDQDGDGDFDDGVDFVIELTGVDGFDADDNLAL